MVTPVGIAVLTAPLEQCSRALFKARGLGRRVYGAAWVVQVLFGHGVKEASAGWARTMAPAVTTVVSRPTIPALVDLRIGGLLNQFR